MAPRYFQVPEHLPSLAAGHARKVLVKQLSGLLAKTAGAVQSFSLRDPGVYTGSAGISYALLRCCQSARIQSQLDNAAPPTAATSTRQPDLGSSPRHALEPASFAAAAPSTSMLQPVLQPQLHKLLQPEELLAAALQYSQHALQRVRSKSHPDQVAALLDGAGGIYAVAALANAAAAAEATDPQVTAACMAAASQHCQTYCSLLNPALACSSDEILYGRAGWLLGALVLRKELGEDTVPQASMQAVVDAILSSGRQLASRLRWPTTAYGTHPDIGSSSSSSSSPPRPPLMYLWPRDARGGGGDAYLGAAHGLMGIVYVLLLCGPALIQQALPDLRACLSYILSLEQSLPGCPPGGHWPVMCALPGQLPGQEDEEALLHWCHGSPGAVYLFCQAYEVCGDAQYLAAASRAGGVVWARGLLRKGHGLCHGTSGNAYALLRLYRCCHTAYSTNADGVGGAVAGAGAASMASAGPAAETWLQRALAFALHMDSPMGLSVDHTPDSPLSLYEGRGGALCLLAGLLSHGEDVHAAAVEARFPLFDV